MRVMSLGEILWDVYPDRERLGGAAFNFAANIHRLGDTSALISAVGDDHRGRLASQNVEKSGVLTEALQVVTSAPTGTAVVNLDRAGIPAFAIPRPAAYDRMVFSQNVLDWVFRFNADWLYFGTLLHTNPAVEAFTSQIVQGSPNLRIIYDVNLRKDNWDIALVRRLCRLADVLKLNLDEARTLFGASASAQAEFSLESFCTEWTSEFGFEVICVTLGGDGCCIFSNGRFWRSPGYPVDVCDTVGSGDAFAAGLLYGYGRGWGIPETGRLANAFGALVAGRFGAIPEISLDECLAMASLSTRQEGEVSTH